MKNERKKETQNKYVKKEKFAQGKAQNRRQNRWKTKVKRISTPRAYIPMATSVARAPLLPAAAERRPAVAVVPPPVTPALEVFEG
jgi:hypothetical protein